MTASVVTFTYQLGTDYSTIARAVAERLQYRYYDWEIIWRAAAEAGVPPEAVAMQAEHVPGFIERILTGLAVVGADPEDAPVAPSGPRLSILTSDDYRQIVEHVVAELGQRGSCVIVGHASQAILADAPGALKVLLVSSFERRVEAIAGWQAISIEEATKTVKGSDAERAAFFKRAHHLDWLDARHYDLTFSLDTVPNETAVELITATAALLP